jgi:polysaccharide export outer membrane protein
MKLLWKAAIAAVFAANCAMAQDAPAPAATAPTAVTAPAADKKTGVEALAGPDYVIGPEDGLSINVWKEADLTATLPVRPDGKISLPLLGDVQAAGLTPLQLSNSITEKLKKFVADPRVTVVVTAINSKHVYLVGELAHTGAMPMTPNMTVLQALSAAGLNQFANTKRIYVMRSQNGKQEKFPVNYRKLLKGEAMDQNYLLQPGDTIVVP